MANGVGSYEGPVRVEWVRGAELAHYMRLLQEFAFNDPNGKRWVAAAGYETDGASIPRAFWTLVGGPFEGQYREAAVIHDQYCSTKTETWQATHRVFYDGMIASGVSPELAKTLYAGVLLGGPKWGLGVPGTSPGMLIDAVRIQPDAKGMLTKVRAVSDAEAQVLRDWVRANHPSLKQIETHVLTHFPERRPTPDRVVPLRKKAQVAPAKKMRSRPK
jgi:hypothetical protein